MENKQAAAQSQQLSRPDWVKASELKEIDWPLCIKYDGGGAPWYTTVCSMDELMKHVSEFNPLDKIYYLHESPPIESESQQLSWVNVKDRLPETNGFYYVYDENNHGSKYEVYRFDKYNESWYWGADCFHPTHWMLLPAAPSQSPPIESEREWKWTDELVLEFAVRSHLPNREITIQEFREMKLHKTKNI